MAKGEKCEFPLPEAGTARDRDFFAVRGEVTFEEFEKDFLPFYEELFDRINSRVEQLIDDNDLDPDDVYLVVSEEDGTITVRGWKLLEGE